MTEPLSPAAQAVLDAYWKADPKSTEHTDAYEVAGIAAALRAAADQVVPEDYEPPTKNDEFVRGMVAGKTLRNTDVRAAVYRLADELEGQ